MKQAEMLSQEIILTRLTELDEKFTKLMNMFLEMQSRKEDEILGDEITITKGQMNKAENTIEKWFENFSGNVITQLDFTDKTTFGYLDSIPKNCGIQIITSVMKEIDKCIVRAEKCARGRPYLEIMRIDKIHERWIGSNDSYFIEIGTDLKSDALGHSTHTIKKITPKAFRKSISRFQQLWDRTAKELHRIYGDSMHKSIIYSSRVGEQK